MPKYDYNDHHNGIDYDYNGVDYDGAVCGHYDNDGDYNNGERRLRCITQHQLQNLGRNDALDKNRGLMRQVHRCCHLRQVCVCAAIG